MSVYRVKYGIGLSGSAGTGDRRYYEDEEAMKADLLVAFLESARKNTRFRGHKYRIFGAWIEKLKGRDNYPRFSDVFSVDKMIDNEWTPVAVEFIPPEVLLDIDT
jgi:hypothetical protein